MGPRPVERSVPVDAELRRDLHAFLCREAPWLLPELAARIPDGGLEAALVAAIERRARPQRGLARLPIRPGLTHAAAAAAAAAEVSLLVRGFFERRRIRASLTRDERLVLLRTMLLARAIDDFLKERFDRKDVSWGPYPSPQKGFRGRGQEAIAGAALRLRRPPEWGSGDSYRGDYISQMIRDLPALLLFMGEPAHLMLLQYGKLGTPMGGRDLHPGDFARGIVPSAAPLAIAAQTLIGVAYALKLRNEPRVCVNFIGDGGTSLGEWHEAVNFAAAQALPVVFVVENNQWALGTHVSEQTAAQRFALKAAGYGIPGVTVFGNDPEEVAAAVSWSAERARSGAGPTLVELETYRATGHAHHDDTRFHGVAGSIPGYEDQAEAAAWAALDPIALYEERLRGLGLVDGAALARLHEAIADEVAAAATAAAAAPWPQPADYRQRVEAPRIRPVPDPPAAPVTRRLSYDEAVRQTLAEMMEEDPSVYVLGEDVGGRYGGAFGVTRGLAKRFGPARCLNTPIAESAIVGCAVGSALMGLRPVVEMQFADFLACAFNALVNNAAKVHWRWGRAVPMVVRLPYGGATGTGGRLLGGGPFHSQCPEMWFFRTPGFKIVAPSTPADAKGLLIAALRDENPVVYLEAKGLYGLNRPDLREEVPLGTLHEVPLGKAAVRRAGSDLTLVTYGAMVWTALAAAESLGGEGIDVEVLDLRSLWPLDVQAVLASVGKTGRLLVLHEDTRRGGLAGEIAALVADHAFWRLDAPIRRVTAPDTPVPYAPPLELDFLPQVPDILAAARRLAAE